MEENGETEACLVVNTGVVPCCCSFVDSLTQEMNSKRSEQEIVTLDVPCMD